VLQQTSVHIKSKSNVLSTSALDKSFKFRYFINKINFNSDETSKNSSQDIRQTPIKNIKITIRDSDFNELICKNFFEHKAESTQENESDLPSLKDLLSGKNSQTDGMSQVSKEMSSFHFDGDELNISINKHEVTPSGPNYKKEYIKTLAVGSTFEKSSSTDIFNSKSTRKYRDDSKELSKLTSKNLIGDFDKTSDSHQKIKNSKTVSNYEILTSAYKTKQKSKSRVLANKIRLFNSKFINKEDLTPVMDSVKKCYN
jgi:hypothetical protein